MKEKDRVVFLVYCACGAVFELLRHRPERDTVSIWLKKPCPVCGKDDRIWKTAEIGSKPL